MSLVWNYGTADKKPGPHSFADRLSKPPAAFGEHLLFQYLGDILGLGIWCGHLDLGYTLVHSVLDLVSWNPWIFVQPFVGESSAMQAHWTGMQGSRLCKRRKRRCADSFRIAAYW